MRDLTGGGRPPLNVRPPKGIAFEIAELLQIRVWAEGRGVGISVMLDHGVEDEEYEEVVAFKTNTGSLARLMIWRSVDAVFIQPMLGRGRCYDTVASALRNLAGSPPVGITDIRATEWPDSNNTRPAA